MFDSLFYIKINQSNDVQIENEALKVFIRWIRPKGSDQIVFAECGAQEDVFYVFGIEWETMQKIAEFQKTGVNIEFMNISETVLKGKPDNLFLQTFKEGINKSKLISYVNSKQTIDKILDKIINQGIESLTEFDKSYLDKYCDEKS